MLNRLFGRRRNRRVGEREHLLDVKLRTSQVRAARMRVLSVAALVIVCLIGAWRGTVFLLNYTIYKNDAFSIQQIDVQTDGVLTSDIVRRWAMVGVGQNLMALDLVRVQRDLEMQPPIQFAAVERVLPHTLRLIVNERVPIAQAVMMEAGPDGHPLQTMYNFDEDGYAMKPLDPSWRTTPAPAAEHLPYLVGVPPGEVQLGRPTESPQIRGALRLISELDRSAMAGMVDFHAIDVSVPEILRATTGQGAQVTFSLNQFDQQLRRWRVICDQYQKWGRAITWIDLSIANNLPVRSVAYNGLPPQPAPHSAKPQRSRRKHV